MIITIALLFVYFLGYVLCYRFIRKDLKDKLSGRWTSGDRKIALVVSTLSFIGLFIWFMAVENNEEATW